jgi:uncharacterized protein (DUF983 family)
VAVMEQYRAHFTGAWVAQCHACGTVCTSWDADDLNDAGELVCGCEWDLDKCEGCGDDMGGRRPNLCVSCTTLIVVALRQENRRDR